MEVPRSEPSVLGALEILAKPLDAAAICASLKLDDALLNGSLFAGEPESPASSSKSKNASRWRVGVRERELFGEYVPAVMRVVSECAELS